MKLDRLLGVGLGILGTGCSSFVVYLYHHFNSDGHTLKDIRIMPIEEMVSEPDDTTSLACT